MFFLKLRIKKVPIIELIPKIRPNFCFSFLLIKTRTCGSNPSKPNTRPSLVETYDDARVIEY